MLGALSLALVNLLPDVNKMLAQRVTSNGLQDYDRVRFATQNLALRRLALTRSASVRDRLSWSSTMRRTACTCAF